MSEKKPIVLKKNAWHAKQMTWIWNFKPTDFPWGCPYFWLSVINVVIVIPFTPLKLLFLGLKWLYEKYNKAMTFYINSEYERLYNKLVENPNLAMEVCKNSKASKLSNFIDWIWSYRDSHPMSSDIIQKLRDARSQRKSDLSTKKSKRSLTNKELIAKITKFAKPIATVIIWALVLFIGYFLFKWFIQFIVYLFHLPTKSWKNFWAGLLQCVVGTAFIAFIVWLCTLVGNTSGFKGVFRQIGNFFRFIVDVIKNACPAIVWKD